MLECSKPVLSLSKAVVKCLTTLWKPIHRSHGAHPRTTTAHGDSLCPDRRIRADTCRGVKTTYGSQRCGQVWRAPLPKVSIKSSVDGLSSYSSEPRSSSQNNSSSWRFVVSCPKDSSRYLSRRVNHSRLSALWPSFACAALKSEY